MCDLIVYVLRVQLCYSNCYYLTKSVLLIMLNKIQFNSIVQGGVPGNDILEEVIEELTHVLE